MAEPIKIFKGDDVEFQLAIANDDGTPVNLTGCTVYFSAKAKADDRAVVLSVVQATHLDAINGKTLIALPRSQTELAPVTSLFGDIRIKDSNDKVTTIGLVTVKIVQNVTRI